MSYRNSAKNRKLKRTLLKCISVLKFDSFHQELPYKITFIGSILGSVSLFMGWIGSSDNSIQWNAFHGLLGLNGLILLCIYVSIFFIVLNTKQKDSLKKLLHLNTKDGVFLFFLCIFALTCSVNSLFVIDNLSILKSGIVFGQGIIFSLIGNIFALVGGIWLLTEKTKTAIYIDETDSDVLIHDPSAIDEQNNMKLPF